MESTNILNKIMTMLSVGKQVNLTGDVYGKLEDGTPLASDAFEVGHDYREWRESKGTRW